MVSNVCVDFVGLISNNYITMHGEKNLKFLVFLLRCFYLPNALCLLRYFAYRPRCKMRSPLFWLHSIDLYLVTDL